MEVNDMRLGTIILKLCKERGISLSALARQSGVPPQTLHHWTTGRRSVNPDQLRKVASTLKVSLHYLTFGEPDPHEQPLSEEILKEIFSGDIRVTLHKIERRKK